MIGVRGLEGFFRGSVGTHGAVPQSQTPRAFFALRIPGGGGVDWVVMWRVWMVFVGLSVVACGKESEHGAGDSAGSGGSGGSESGAGGDAGAPASGASGGASGSGTGGTSGNGGSAGSSGNAGGGGEGNSAGAGEDGRLGVPETTFTLPIPNASEGLPALYHPDLAADFPEVDFATLDRLYIQGARYRSVLLGGLPQRSAE